MKKLKIVNKELGKELKRIRKSNSDKYSRITKSQKAISHYYKENEHEIERDTLIKKYKSLTYDIPNMLAIFTSFITALLASLFWFFMTYYLNLKLDNIVIKIIVYVVFILCISIVMFFAIKKLIEINHMFDYYVEPFHAKVIEKILEKKGFYVDNNKQYKRIKKLSKGK